MNSRDFNLWNKFWKLRLPKFIIKKYYNMKGTEIVPYQNKFTTNSVTISF